MDYFHTLDTQEFSIFVTTHRIIDGDEKIELLQSKDCAINLSRFPLIVLSAYFSRAKLTI